MVLRTRALGQGGQLGLKSGLNFTIWAKHPEYINYIHHKYKCAMKANSGLAEKDLTISNYHQDHHNPEHNTTVTIISL